MSKASKLNRHLAGWRRGQPKPQAIVRTTQGKAAPRFVKVPPPPPRAPRPHFTGLLADLPSREEEQRERLRGRGFHGGCC